MGKLQEGATVPTNMDIVGAPDICITSVEEPHLFSAMGENNLVKERKWRDIGKKVEKGEASREDSTIGQLQFRRLQVTRRSEKKVTPILGIYFDTR